MDINEVNERLEELSSTKLKRFNSNLIPGSSRILGAKIPDLRILAKEIAKGDYKAFLEECPDEYYEHEILQAMVIGYAKDDIAVVLACADSFIPKIHDWSVNDCFCQTFKAARKHRELVWEWLKPYAGKNEEFPQRVVAVMLMSHFLVDDYIDCVLGMMDQLQNPGYYTKMGVAWCVATAYAKYPEKTLVFLKNNRLADWTYNKSIQKMLESFRVLDGDKRMLREMKRNSK